MRSIAVQKILSAEYELKDRRMKFVRMTPPGRAWMVVDFPVCMGDKIYIRVHENPRFVPGDALEFFNLLNLSQPLRGPLKKGLRIAQHPGSGAIYTTEEESEVEFTGLTVGDSRGAYIQFRFKELEGMWWIILTS